MSTQQPYDMQEQRGAARPQQPGRLVVGIDGTPGSDAALDMALAQAQLTGLPVVVLYAYWPPVPRQRGTQDQVDARRALLVAEASVDRALGRRQGAQDLDLDVRVRKARPEEALRDLVEASDLLVLGATGQPGGVLGGTARSCVFRTACAVMVVPAHTPTVVQRVVLGLDPLDMPLRAVAWADDAAQRYACGVLLVASWRSGDLEELGVPAAGAPAAVQERVRDLLPSSAGRVPTEVVVRRGRAADVVREQMRSGDLLVLGTRGRAGQFPAGLRSVSGELLDAAPWPVVLVPR